MPQAPACCHQGKQSFFKNKLFLVTFTTLVLVILSYIFAPLAPFRKILFHYAGSIWWAVLAGLFLGGIIEHYIPKEYVSKILARNSAFTILNAVFLGFLMSACSHGILALSIQLHKKGASNPAVVSFLLASPWANFAVTMMLLSLFGLKGMLIILAAIIIAINTGLIFMFLEKKGWIEQNKNIVPVASDYSIIANFRERLSGYKFNRDSLVTDAKGVCAGLLMLAQMVLGWIILGVLLASLAGAFIPVHFFHKFMSPALAGLFVTLILATVIEVCSEGSSPLAFEIYRQTQALGNSFVFLMAGVVTDYTEIGLLWSNLGRRVALWMPLIAVPQVIALGYLFNLLIK
ncbi:MAG: permease [Candidatus Omnitrophica bacterium]|nr:permease [Candidatus Omnitrophota bacterium]